MDKNKNGWWPGVAAALAMSMCCGLPLLVATFGAGAVAAIAEYGSAGLVGVGVLGGGLYLLRRASRRCRCDSGQGSAASDIRGPDASMYRRHKSS